MTSSFKIKYYLNGSNSCGIDNIKVIAMDPDTGITFKIDGTTVYLDDADNPGTGQQLFSTKTQLLHSYYNSTSSVPNMDGYAYSCFRDVTALVRAYAEQPEAPATNYNGHATYSVVGDIGDTGTCLSYAGWSLILIFTSPETLEHQIYLYDDFISSGQNSTTGLNVDFDGDGQPGGTVRDFVVPQQISGEINAAKLTYFVGEGDEYLTGDYVAMNGQKLWDGTVTNQNTSLSYPNNIWNGQSKILGSNDGVDIDTPGINPNASPPQYITWSSGILQPGDATAEVTLYTQSDVWFMVYSILSFRSEITTGGSLSYLIHN
jgi:hypothetical protein